MIKIRKNSKGDDSQKEASKHDVRVSEIISSPRNSCGMYIINSSTTDYQNYHFRRFLI